MLEDSDIWLLGAYFVGTIMGWHFSKISAAQMAEQTIDVLIDGGFLKSRTNENGEIELIKVNQSND